MGRSLLTSAAAVLIEEKAAHSFSSSFNSAASTSDWRASKPGWVLGAAANCASSAAKTFWTVSPVRPFFSASSNCASTSAQTSACGYPQALVCADVLAQLDDAEKKGRTGETVQKVFAAEDA